MLPIPPLGRRKQGCRHLYKLAQDAGEEYVAWFKRNLPKTETVKPKAAKATKAAA